VALTSINSGLTQVNAGPRQRGETKYCVRITGDDRMTRDELLDDITAEFAETAVFTGCGVPSTWLLAALRKVPRERFVPTSERDLAYENTALPIGHRQTISQPFIVAIMTELLHVTPGATVLEIGTGSGYQAAVLAELGARVFTVEVIPELAAHADESLRGLGYRDIRVRVGDGNLGWPEYAPYDGIIVTAAAEDVPTVLASQLRPGGRMVIPLGPASAQVLTVVTKRRDGAVHRQPTIPVAFVPFVHAAPSTPQPA
jgi:protein-L-isoaspartate(D-aspartate) O-methyltransferase